MSRTAGGRVGGDGVEERLRTMGCDGVELLRRMSGRKEGENGKGKRKKKERAVKMKSGGGKIIGEMRII